MTDQAIKQLVRYAAEQGLIDEADSIWAINRLLEVLQKETFDDPQIEEALPPLENILAVLLDDAVARGLITDDVTSRDLFDTKLMGALTPPPSAVTKQFHAQYAISPEHATDFFYRFSRATDYIRTYRVAKDLKWQTETEYGLLDVTVNLSKPEKSPEEIAAAKKPSRAATRNVCSARKTRATPAG